MARISSIPCKEVTGLSCDYVIKAEEHADLRAGRHSDHMIGLISLHIGQAHQEGLNLEEREALRARLGD